MGLLGVPSQLLYEEPRGRGLWTGPGHGVSGHELVPPFWSRQQAPNITIREDLAPGSEVVQVRARGFDVRYEILSPVPCPLFSIGRGEGHWGGGCVRNASVAGLKRPVLPPRAPEKRGWSQGRLGRGGCLGAGLELEGTSEMVARVARLSALPLRWSPGRMGTRQSWGRG